MTDGACELCGRTLEVDDIGKICRVCKHEYEVTQRAKSTLLQTPSPPIGQNPAPVPLSPVVHKKPANVLAIAILGCLGLAVIFIVGSFIAGNWDPGGKAIRQLEEIDRSTATPAHDGPRASMNEYSQLQTGMSYQQVCEIIGGEGTEMSSNEIAGSKTVIYMWDGEGDLGANMNAIFQNDKLIQKSQFGLK